VGRNRRGRKEQSKMIALFKAILTSTMDSIRAEPVTAGILAVAILAFLALLFWPIPPAKTRGQ